MPLPKILVNLILVFLLVIQVASFLEILTYKNGGEKDLHHYIGYAVNAMNLDKEETFDALPFILPFTIILTIILIIVVNRHPPYLFYVR